MSCQVLLYLVRWRDGGIPAPTNDHELLDDFAVGLGVGAGADMGCNGMPGGSPIEAPGPPGSRGPGGRSGVGRQILLGWCCDRPCLDAARSLEEVRDAVGVAGGTCSVPLMGGLHAGSSLRAAPRCSCSAGR